MPGRHQAGPAVYVGVNVPAGRTVVVVHEQPGGTCCGGTAPDHAHLGRTPCTLIHLHLNLPSLQQRQQPRSPAAKGMNLFPKVSGPAASGLLEMPRRPGDSLRERVGEAAPDPGVSRPAEPDCRRPTAAREGVPTPLPPARGGGSHVGACSWAVAGMGRTCVLPDAQLCYSNPRWLLSCSPQRAPSACQSLGSHALAHHHPPATPTHPGP